MRRAPFVLHRRPSSLHITLQGIPDLAPERPEKAQQKQHGNAHRYLYQQRPTRSTQQKGQQRSATAARGKRGSPSSSSFLLPRAAAAAGKPGHVRSWLIDFHLMHDTCHAAATKLASFLFAAVVEYHNNTTMAIIQYLHTIHIQHTVIQYNNTIAYILITIHVRSQHTQQYNNYGCAQKDIFL